LLKSFKKLCSSYSKNLLNNFKYRCNRESGAFKVFFNMDRHEEFIQLGRACAANSIAASTKRAVSNFVSLS